MANWATTILCPLIGLIITNIMWFAPMKAMLEARKTKQLGELNPLPFSITVLNCVGWTIYGVVIGDQFVFWSNILGICIGMFYVINSMAILYNKSLPGEPFCKEYQYMEWTLLFAGFFWALISLLASQVTSDVDQQNNIIGTACMVFTIAYYGAPLSTMYQVISKRDASSLYPPLIIVNATASTMWFVYGFAINNINIYLPNVIGASLAFFQVLLIGIFYKGGKEQHLKEPLSPANSQA